MGIIKKIKFSLCWDYIWLSEKRIGILSRVTYFFMKYYSFIFHLKEINYLGHTVYSDNVTTPVTLQSYPSEIYNIAKYINLNNRSLILDIGANIGHFSITLSSLYTKSMVYSFEANPDIYKLLLKNVKEISQITPFNLAVGPEGNMPFYYVPGKSAKGSFIKSNAIINLGDVRASELNIDVVELSAETCSKLDIPVTYDLIKIDVEGFEYSVLDALDKIKTKYIYLEFSIGRESGYEFHELIKKIELTFGNIKIIFCDEINVDKSMGNILIQCLDA